MPHGRPDRLPGFDCSSPGWYFVTVVVEGRRRLLGRLAAGAVHLSVIGRLVEDAILETGQRRPWLSVDCHVVMPDHIHLLLGWSATPANRRDTGLGHAVSQIKGISTRAARRARRIPKWDRLWMPGYWEAIVRSPGGVARVRRYIERNPARATERRDRDRRDLAVGQARPSGGAI
jgi:REP element-mobilizing transposase RayT